MPGILHVSTSRTLADFIRWIEASRMVGVAKVGNLVGVIVVLVLWLPPGLRRKGISFSQRRFVCKQECPFIARGARMPYDQKSRRLKQFAPASERVAQVTQT